MRGETRIDRSCVSCGASMAGLRKSRVTCSPSCARENRRVNEARYRSRVRERQKALPAEQVCYACEQTLPAEAFHKNRATLSGLQGMCKACRRGYDRRPDQAAKARGRKSHWYLLHYDEVRAKNRARWHTDPEHRAYGLARKKARYDADREAVLARRRDQWHARKEPPPENACRCVCGKAISTSGEEGAWFCRASCKVRLIRSVTGNALIATIQLLKTGGPYPRLTPDEEGLIRGIAANTASRWFRKGGALEDEDLVSAAYLGAWNAWLTYDAGKGAALKTWLVTGARREVLEALRAADPLSRAERQAYKKTLAVDPTFALPRQILSLDTGAEDPDHVPLADRAASDEDLAQRVVERESAREVSKRVFALFPANEARLGLVVRLIALEGLTRKRVGELLGVSETRVNQLWERAKAKIQAEIAP